MIQTLCKIIGVVVGSGLCLIASCTSSVKDDNGKGFGVEIANSTIISTPILVSEERNPEDIILEVIVIKLPGGLQKMTDDLLTKNYAEKVRPAVAYGNKDMSATFSFSTVPLKNGVKLNELIQVIGKQFEVVYPQINWLSKEIREVDEKSFIEYEFISPTGNTEVYCLVYVTDINESLLISTFSCTSDKKNKWQSLARESMKSIRTIN